MDTDPLNEEPAMVTNNQTDSENDLNLNSQISNSFIIEPKRSNDESEEENQEHSKDIMSLDGPVNVRNSNILRGLEEFPVSLENNVQQDDDNQQLSGNKWKRKRRQNTRSGNTSNNEIPERNVNNVPISNGEKVNIQNPAQNRNRNRRIRKRKRMRSKNFTENLDKSLKLLDLIFSGSNIKTTNFKFNNNLIQKIVQRVIQIKFNDKSIDISSVDCVKRINKLQKLPERYDGDKFKKFIFKNTLKSLKAKFFKAKGITARRDKKPELFWKAKFPFYEQSKELNLKTLYDPLLTDKPSTKATT